MAASHPSANRIEEISTQWDHVTNLEKFVMRYGGPVRAYLNSLLRNADEADEVLQGLLLRLLERGSDHLDRPQGRFRDYLKAAVKNAAISHLRSKQKMPTQMTTSEEQLTAAEVPFDQNWRECVLQRAWRDLDRYQRNSQGCFAYSVLQLVMQYPDHSSQELAERLATDTGHQLTAAAFRKQVSRARRRFAELIAAEVARTLELPTRGNVREELQHLQLGKLVEGFLSEHHAG